MFFTDPSDYNSTFVHIEYNHVIWNRYHEMRPIFTLETVPDWCISGYAEYFGFMNVPLFASMANCTMDDLYLQELLI